MSKKELTKSDFKTLIEVIQKVLEPHKRQVIFLIVFSLIVAVTDAFVPLLAGRIFDSIIAIARGEDVITTGVFSIIIIWTILKFISDVSSWRINTDTDKLGTRVFSEFISSGFSQLLF